MLTRKQQQEAVDAINNQNALTTQSTLRGLANNIAQAQANIAIWQSQAAALTCPIATLESVFGASGVAKE